MVNGATRRGKGVRERRRPSSATAWKPAAIRRETWRKLDFLAKRTVWSTNTFINRILERLDRTTIERASRSS